MEQAHHSCHRWGQDYSAEDQSLLARGEARLQLQRLIPSLAFYMSNNLWITNEIR